jgi:hypothetical protein
MKKQLKNMYRGSLLLLLLLPVTFACQKLDETIYSQVTTETYGTTAFQIEATYAASLNSLWDYWGGYGYGYNPFINDDQFNDGDLVISESAGDDHWMWHYQSVANINGALKAIKVGRVEEDETTLKVLEAQGKFLRAFNYFTLVRMFGDIPLLTEDSENPITNPVARSPIADVYALIVSDLTFASDNLPVSFDGQPGRAGKYAAKGLLAKVYLTMAGFPLNDPSNYAKAAAAAKDVMDNGPYSLLPDCADVFAESNKYSTEMMFCFNSTYDDITTDLQIWVGSDYLDGGWADVKVDTLFEQKYPEQPRKEAYLMTEWNGVHYTESENERYPWFKKFFFYSSENDFNNYTPVPNWPVQRYPDVLLIYAEAANMANNGPTQEAVDALNMIIDRANGNHTGIPEARATLGMSKQEFDDKVIQERSLEFCGEYPDRWFDIVRKRILNDPDVTYHPPYRSNYTIDDYLFAIPREDLKTNPLLEQNPGYSIP